MNNLKNIIEEEIKDNDSEACSISNVDKNGVYEESEELDNNNNEEEEDEYDEGGDSYLSEEEEEEEEHQNKDNEKLLFEELIPIKLDLSNLKSHLKDNFTWPVVVPYDITGENESDYLEYNLKNANIDLFSLRTSEDLDLPHEFTMAISKSIRSQISLYIPIIWKVRLNNLNKKKRFETNNQNIVDVSENEQSLQEPLFPFNSIKK